MIDGKKFFESGTIISKGKNRLLVAWGKRRWQQKPEKNLSVPSFYFPDFFLEDSTPWFQHEAWTEINSQDFLNELKKSSSIEKNHFYWHNDNYVDFQKAFFDLKEQFERKTLTKAVPYVFETCSQQMTPSQLSHSLVHVLQYTLTNPAYVYGFWDQSQGILGATPELLFKFSKQKEKLHLETMACAATCALHKANAFLLHDPKELHEHNVVIQGIHESLRPLGEVHIGQIKLLELPKLVHLLTPIHVYLQSKPDFAAIVRALHPTPALGAFPRKNGLEWLRNYQKTVNRQRYGAPAGFIHKSIEDSACYVAIRNAQWQTGEIAIGSGCGVVAESRWENEWNEVILKLNAIKGLLGLGYSEVSVSDEPEKLLECENPLSLSVSR